MKQAVVRAKSRNILSYCKCSSVIVDRDDRRNVSDPCQPLWASETACMEGKGILMTWWRHQMEAFSALLSRCEGNSPVTGESPAQRPVTRSINIFFDIRLNNRLSKQSRRWWVVMPSRSLWCNCNEIDAVDWYVGAEALVVSRYHYNEAPEITGNSTLCWKNVPC